jgi:hypothetical protein
MHDRAANGRRGLDIWRTIGLIARGLGLAGAIACVPAGVISRRGVILRKSRYREYGETEYGYSDSFHIIVGRRRMAARLETELILSVVPFSMKSLTLRAKCAAGCRCRLCCRLCSAMLYVRILRGSKSYGLLLLSTRELLSYERWLAFAEACVLGIFLTCHRDRPRKREGPA